MNKTSVAITAAFCVAIGFLIARFIGPTEAPAPAKVEKAVVAAPAPAPQPAKVIAPKPVTATPGKRPPMDEATKARYKAFGEETRKMALDLAGGDEKSSLIVDVPSAKRCAPLRPTPSAPRWKAKWPRSATKAWACSRRSSRRSTPPRTASRRRPQPLPLRSSRRRA